MRVTEDGTRIIWSPLAGSQNLALACPAHVIVYHGSRGPGKTDAQLMRFRRRVGIGYGRFWRGVIFDREYKNLDDLVSKSLRWFPEFKDGARFLSSKSDYRWVWPTGEELLFRVVKKGTDYWSYHGQEFPFIGWNELTKYPSDELFDMLMSCNRSSFRPQDHGWFDKRHGMVFAPSIPLEVFATCNPYGVGHNWVKKRFIDAAEAGQIFKKSTNVFNPQTQQREDVVKTQVHLFGSYKENIYLSPEYIAELEGITDPNKRKAWLYGDWDVVAGGIFDAAWDKKYNVVQNFVVPHQWKLRRSFDWGSSKPFSVGWWAISDGCDITLENGQKITTLPGDAFRVFEWYGCTGKPNQGLNMLATDITKGIIEREMAWGIYGRVQPGPGDNSIHNVEDGNSIAASMLKPVLVDGKMYPGITWARSNKAPGSRIAGWEKMRIMMFNAHAKFIDDGRGTQVPVPREKPGIFVLARCKHFIDLVPVLPRDEDNPDDVDTESEDHIGDEARYFILDLDLGGRSGVTSGAY
jgi:hypothetical protein